MVHFAIQQFHANEHVLVFRHLDDALHSDDAVFQSFFVRHALPIAGEHNDAGSAVLRAEFY
jgi:hypothetical protein